MTPISLFDRPQYSLSREEKSRLLLEELNRLTRKHRLGCPAYARLLDMLHPGSAEAGRLSEVPYLPVGLFKSHKLVSVPEEEIFRVLASSGTTGQQVSRIYLDRETADRQTRALASIMTYLLGPRRLPMIIVDAREILRDRSLFSARAVGILGMLSFGRDHVYVLDEAMRLVPGRVEAFLSQHGRSPFLIFGFTYMIWENLYKQGRTAGFDLSHGVLVHSGGWKKLAEEAVDNDTFKSRLREATGLSRVYNFYGMVEQVGSVFLEGEDGFLHAPNFADVIVRDPKTWREAPVGQVGVLQVLSALPGSYPGHSILTEDLGVLRGEDNSTCGRRGRFFSVMGRVPEAELRGCSDIHAYGAGASR